MLDKSCAFTGHRPHKFPWRYNEVDSRCVTLKTALTEQITALAKAGITDFYSGGDCWAALIVLELRKKNPALRLHCILPHEGQADKWSDSAQDIDLDNLNEEDVYNAFTHSFFNRFRKLLVRFEKKASNYLALVQFACAVIVWRKLIFVHL